MSNEIDVKEIEDKVNGVLSEINDGSLFEIEFERFHIWPMTDLYFKGARKNPPYGVHGQPENDPCFNSYWSNPLLNNIKYRRQSAKKRSISTVIISDT